MEQQNASLSARFVQLGRSTPVSCSGLYCGRTKLPTGFLSDCAACPRGFRPVVNSICEPCSGPLTQYAWMYLAFMALLPLILHLTVIDMIFRKFRTKKNYVILQTSAVLEAVAAGVTSLALFRSDDKFAIRFCGADRLSDWYSLFHNPKPDHVSTLGCTQEVVYPLYSIVFVYYFLSVLFMLVFRACSAKWTWSNMARNALLAGLYQYPVLLAVNACCAGLLYFIFPYMVLILASMCTAIQCAVLPDQTVGGIFRGLLTSTHSVVVLILQWLCLAFGIFAVSHDHSFQYASLRCLTVICPMIAYVFTARLTDPKRYFENFEK